jgi:bifunctional DNase/RNase
MALATLTGSPIFVAEDVLQDAGIDIPRNKQISPEHTGAGSILKEIAEMHALAAKSTPGPKIAREEMQQIRADLTATLFKTS